MKTLYWSRKPGNFVNKTTGESVSLALKRIKTDKGTTLPKGPVFTGTTREWYETLVETIIDCKRGMLDPVLFVNRDVSTFLEATFLFRPNIDDSDPTFLGSVSNTKVFRDDRLQNEILIVSNNERRSVIITDMGGRK